MTGTPAALAVLTSTSLSPTITARVGLPPASAMTPGPVIDLAGANHHGAGGFAARKRDDAGQVARVGLGDGEGVAPGDRAEIAFKLKRLEEPPAEVFPLLV